MQLHSISNYLFGILALDMTLLIHGRALSEQMAEQVAQNTRRTCSFCLFRRHTRFSGNYRTVMSQSDKNQPLVSAFANECVCVCVCGNTHHV